MKFLDFDHCTVVTEVNVLVLRKSKHFGVKGRMFPI